MRMKERLGFFVWIETDGVNKGRYASCVCVCVCVIDSYDAVVGRRILYVWCERE